MEKQDKTIIEMIVAELQNSSDKKVQDMLKAFPERKELLLHVGFYYNKSFDDMKRISSLDYYLRKRKYHYAKGRLLQNRTKAMPDTIYHSLIDYVGNHVGEKIKLALEFEGIEGPRGEDTVCLRDTDLDFEHHSVKILNRKRNRWYELPLNKELEKELKAFISKNRKEIMLHHGFVFFSSNPVQKNDHITQKYLKTLVHNVLNKLGLNKVYAKSSSGRDLCLYSLHSLRGHAATQVDVKSHHDLKKVQELLDHEIGSVDTTLLYLERNNDMDLRGLI